MEVSRCLPGLYFFGSDIESRRLNSQQRHWPRDIANLGRDGPLQAHSLDFEPDTCQNKHHRPKVLGLKEEALVQVIDESKNNDDQIPFDRSQYVFIARAQEAAQSVAEGEAKDEQYKRESYHAHLKCDVQESVLCLPQSPCDGENDSIRFAFESQPECLISIAEKRSLCDRRHYRIPYLSPAGQRDIFSKHAEQEVGLQHNHRDHSGEDDE